MCDAYCVHDVSAAASEQQSNNARPLWTTTNAIISIQPFAVLFLRRVDDRDFERRTFRKSISSPLARFHLQISLRRRPLRARFNYLSCSRTRCVRSSVGSFAIYLFRAVMDPRMDYRSLPRSLARHTTYPAAFIAATATLARQIPHPTQNEFSTLDEHCGGPRAIRVTVCPLYTLHTHTARGVRPTLGADAVEFIKRMFVCVCVLLADEE